MLDWVLDNRRMRRLGEWDMDGDARRRELTSAANDGIISSAAILQGLLSAGASGREAYIGVLALTVVGGLTTGAAQYGEAAAERRSQLAIIEAEQQRLLASPDEEFAELLDHYRAKGLTEELAYAVASELHEHDALAAQLDSEYDLEHAHSARWPWRMAITAALAFLAGSLGPFLLFLLIPAASRGEVTLIAVLVSLAVSGYIGSRAEHGNAFATIARTILIGLIVLGVSTFAGSQVSF